MRPLGSEVSFSWSWLQHSFRAWSPWLARRLRSGPNLVSVPGRIGWWEPRQRGMDGTRRSCNLRYLHPHCGPLRWDGRSTPTKYWIKHIFTWIKAISCYLHLGLTGRSLEFILPGLHSMTSLNQWDPGRFTTVQSLRLSLREMGTLNKVELLAFGNGIRFFRHLV